MLMSPCKLILLRIYSITFGRIGLFAKALKKVLVLVLVKRRKDKYVASSRYFNLEELNRD